MVVECIFVGTELLLGEILNTNAQYLSQQLAQLGIDCYHQATVGDNPARLASALRLALSRSDVVVTTGGLGPTLDDLTKETVAEVLGLELAFHEPSWAAIENVFRGRRRQPSAANRKQALFPPGADVLPNGRGTAPGMIVPAGDKAVVVLPGPPRELQPMFADSVRPWLTARLQPGHQQLYTRTLHFAGIGESDLFTALEDMFSSEHGVDGVLLAPYAKLGEVHLRLSFKSPSAAAAEAPLAAAEKAVRDRVGRYVYGADADTLASAAGALLRQRGQRVAVAESCTGGLLGKQLTDSPGSSGYFEGGVIAYSNAVKTGVLGVPAKLLEAHGAVSAETAAAMAEGVCRLTGAEFGLGVTGVAGPGGGTPDKPAGTVFIAVASPAGTAARRAPLRFGDRDTVRRLAAQEALRRLWVMLNEGTDYES